MADARTHVPQKHKAQAPLNEADPLELHAPCLTIGSLDIQHEKNVLKEMFARANTAIREFCGDVHYAAQIPDDAEAKEVVYKIQVYIFNQTHRENSLCSTPHPHTTQA